MFDLHIHIARFPYKEQLTQLLLDRNYRFIAIACEPWEWKDVSLLKKNFSTGLKPIRTAYGIHPMIAQQATDDMFTKLRAILKDDKHAMVGEAGIDKRYPGYDNGTQDRVFLEQAKIALELHRDLQIHCVGDYTRVLNLLEDAGFKTTQKASRPIFHRFGGDLNIVKKALPLGALFSLHADSFRKKSTAAAIPLIPESSVFFETDADETFLQSCHAEHHPENAKSVNKNAVISDTCDFTPLVELGSKEQAPVASSYPPLLDQGSSEERKEDLHQFIQDLRCTASTEFNRSQPLDAFRDVDDKHNTGMTGKNIAEMISDLSADGQKGKKNPEQPPDTKTIVAEIVEKLENRLESVRSAYAKSLE